VSCYIPGFSAVASITMTVLRERVGLWHIRIDKSQGRFFLCSGLC